MLACKARFGKLSRKCHDTIRYSGSTQIHFGTQCIIAAILSYRGGPRLYALRGNDWTWKFGKTARHLDFQISLDLVFIEVP